MAIIRALRASMDCDRFSWFMDREYGGLGRRSMLAPPAGVLSVGGFRRRDQEQIDYRQRIILAGHHNSAARGRISQKLRMSDSNGSSVGQADDERPKRLGVVHVAKLLDGHIKRL
jgi:hypothetical protein